MTGQGATPSPDSHGDPVGSSFAQRGFDTGVAHSARVYDYLLGGKDNFAADRVAAEQVIEVYPDVLLGVRANRAFLHRAVEYLAREVGIRQFLDVGTGLPTTQNTHEVAQAIAPECRVVYVDNDPIVLAHAQALLASTPEGATSYIEADAQDTATILARAAETLDLSRPVAVMALMILQYIPDSDAPHEIIARLMEAMPSGSYLTVSDLTRDIDGTRLSPTISQLNTHMGPTSVTLRTHEDIAGFLGGLELVPPGVVPLPEWRGTEEFPPGAIMPAYAGMGRKP